MSEVNAEQEKKVKELVLAAVDECLAVMSKHGKELPTLFPEEPLYAEAKVQYAFTARVMNILYLNFHNITFSNAVKRAIVEGDL